ncbi:MAG: LysR family transcriptional regulator [Cypionkella sp.]|nr:LysR family transcriptional regulator [Cypionkella sp.]
MTLADDSTLPILRGIKMGHLRLMAELRATGHLTLAAERLGLAQPAASRLLAQIEDLVGHPLREKRGRSLRLTSAGEALARRAERILLELTDAARDMAEAAEGEAGHVRVGSVTGPALSHLLPVLRAMRASFPAITVEVVIATSDILTDQVQAGKLDFALGRVPPADQGQLTQRILGREPISFVVRHGHKLLAQPKVTLTDLLAHDWIMPEDDKLLKDSDAVAPLASAVVDSFTQGAAMPIARLPLVAEIEVEAYGLFHLRGARLPPAAERVARMILERVDQAGRP